MYPRQIKTPAGSQKLVFKSHVIANEEDTIFTGSFETKTTKQPCHISEEIRVYLPLLSWELNVYFSPLISTVRARAQDPTHPELLLTTKPAPGGNTNNPSLATGSAGIRIPWLPTISTALLWHWEPQDMTWRGVNQNAHLPWHSAALSLTLAASSRIKSLF